MGSKNPLIEKKDREPKTILVFAKDEALAEALTNQSDSRVILVTPDQRQTDQNLLTFCINPEVTSDYIRLFEELEKRGFLLMSSCTREKHFTRVTAFSAAWNQFFIY
ncbi:KR prefix domain-containing protein [Bacillus velezensis]